MEYSGIVVRPESGAATQISLLPNSPLIWPFKQQRYQDVTIFSGLTTIPESSILT